MRSVAVVLPFQVLGAIQGRLRPAHPTTKPLLTPHRGQWCAALGGDVTHESCPEQEGSH